MRKNIVNLKHVAHEIKKVLLFFNRNLYVTASQCSQQPTFVYISLNHKDHWYKGLNAHLMLYSDNKPLNMYNNSSKPSK